MKRCCTFFILIIIPLVASADDPRLGKPKDYNGYFPWTPPKSKEEWQQRRQQVREQVLLANGLWPMPAKMPLRPVIHGKIERDGYTIEKVYFASHPGHYVTGNLYRPSGKTGKLPAVLSPHGHWANGRFFEANDKTIDAQIKQGAEKTREGAKYPLQARCAQLARMGCVVFHYDMVGYADSKQIPHRTGFTDPLAELWLQNFMGLQTFNSIRAFDFLASLPDVDPHRIGVTGASGGGTQTFILCAVDDRPAAAFPAVMVGTAMQGGCICENCSYLRVGTGNIELVGLFAPRPVGMSGANDWTIKIEQDGLPQLKVLYQLLGAPDKVMAKTHAEFGHNYNQVSRELMYNFFNKHLQLGQPEPVTEKPFVPVPPKELSVWDDQHRLPQDVVDVQGLRRYLREVSEKQLADLLPRNAQTLAEFRQVLAPALRAMITDSLPEPEEILAEQAGDKLLLRRKSTQEEVPAQIVRPKDHDGTIVVWVHPEGVSSLQRDGQLVPAAKQILGRKAAILAVDVFRTGATGQAPRPPINKGYAGFTFGYNRPLLANRVSDILTAVAFAKGQTKEWRKKAHLIKDKQVHLLGFQEAGPWVALARGLSGDAVGRTAADLNQFCFEQVKSMEDDMMLPGALKYGGLLNLTALAAPHELWLHNAQNTGPAGWLAAAYKMAGQPGNLQRSEERVSPDMVVNWLLR